MNWPAWRSLRTVPEIDSRRIAVVGHSFGGKLALLEVERDADLRAAVTFAAAAESWIARLNCVSAC